MSPECWDQLEQELGAERSKRKSFKEWTSGDSQDRLPERSDLMVTMETAVKHEGSVRLNEMERWEVVDLIGSNTMISHGIGNIWWESL